MICEPLSEFCIKYNVTYILREILLLS